MMNHQCTRKLLIIIACTFSIFQSQAAEIKAVESDLKHINASPDRAVTSVNTFVKNDRPNTVEKLEIDDIALEVANLKDEILSIKESLSFTNDKSNKSLAEEYISVASNAIGNWVTTVALIFTILSISLIFVAKVAYGILFSRLDKTMKKYTQDAHAQLVKYTESYSKCSIFYAAAIRKRALAGIYLNISYSFWRQSENSPDDVSEKSEKMRNFKSAIVYGKYALEQSESNIKSIESKDGKLARQFKLLTDEEINNWRGLNLTAKSNLAYYLSEQDDENSANKALHLAKTAFEESKDCRSLFNGKWINWHETYAHVLLKSKKPENVVIAKGIIFMLQNDAKEIDSEWVNTFLVPKYKDLLS